MTLFRIAKEFLRSQKIPIALLLFFQLMQVVMNLVLPAINARIIDEGIVAKNSTLIWQQGLVMLLVTALQISFMIGAAYYTARIAMELGRDLRRDIFTRVQHFPATEQHHFGAPTLITRTTNDVTQVQMVVMMCFAMLLSTPLMGVGGVVMALSQDVQLSALLLVVVPSLAAIITVVAIKLIPTYEITQSRIDRLNTLLREQLTGVRVIRAFVKQDVNAKKFDKANHALRKIWLKIGWLWAFLFPASMLIIGAASASVVWFGGFRITSGQMQVGTLTAYISYLMMISFSAIMAGMIVMFYPRGEISAKRLAEIRNTIPNIVSPERPQELPAKSLTFALEHVTLQYPGAEEPVLENLSLQLTPGKTVGVIGATGSGKSSLVKLFPRLIDASAGRVCVNGISVQHLDLAKLRAAIALVPQKAFLFRGNIASNVAGIVMEPDDIDATAEEKAQKHAELMRRIDLQRVETALAAAAATEFVEKLTDGIFSPVESGGQNFSGGQRQRLTIARAIYRCLPDNSGKRAASLLIFDDSFSALDFATDARLRHNLRKYLGDIAVLIIGQRIATIRDADEIIVLEHGKIDARGTHTQLLQKNAIYQEIVQSQLQLEEA
ncbi:ABC transporter ATP-binding protein [Arcanobacterium hippocoleae]|uniref:ABC transporter ATP-binding protein n=1 Tax=Arcanobacterium hippocoleae TaxID=149017 RepID=UPI00333F3A67